MKKYLFIALLLITSTVILKAQTAFDYTKIDCNSVNQNLYTTLNQGNVVVLIYEHQCPSCLTGANNIKSVINNYYSANTNVKVWYLDNGGYSCTSINTWITNNSLIAGTVFQYSSDFSSPYGSAMPVIVVAGGIAHNTYLVSLGPSNVTNIHNAIETALASIGIEEFSSSANAVNVYPNPISGDAFTLYFNSPLTQTINAEIYDINGRAVKPDFNLNVSTGVNSKEINIGDISNGIYFIQLRTNDGVFLKKLFINR